MSRCCNRPERNQLLLASPDLPPHCRLAPAACWSSRCMSRPCAPASSCHTAGGKCRIADVKLARTISEQVGAQIGMRCCTRSCWSRPSCAQKWNWHRRCRFVCCRSTCRPFPGSISLRLQDQPRLSAAISMSYIIATATRSSSPWAMQPARHAGSTDHGHVPYGDLSAANFMPAASRQGSSTRQPEPVHRPDDVGIFVTVFTGAYHPGSRDYLRKCGSFTSHLQTGARLCPHTESRRPSDWCFPR